MTLKTWTVQEVTHLFHSFGLKCDVNTVLNWISDEKLIAYHSQKGTIIKEKDAYEFLYNYRWEGSPYENGIDDQTKIERLEELIHELKEENTRLRNDILNLEIRLGISPFD